ncbi:MAG: helix-turn-helix transcriptional regulator [Bacteroidales bacterium]|jgi:transcriptional regulator with XRE-family HTH domain|nr:helix-turn-helix transcriptional regulator [Bacteroidales bacterium]
MNNRLQQFLAAENITQASFANTIEVAPASVSHILQGRNKPGFDFLVSMSEHYPELNLEWFLTGKGKMYKNIGGDTRGDISETKTDTDSLFGFDNGTADEGTGTLFEDAVPEKDAAGNDMQNGEGNPRLFNSKIGFGGPGIVKVIVFFDDNTFKEIK